VVISRDQWKIERGTSPDVGEKKSEGSQSGVGKNFPFNSVILLCFSNF
jgi:hypothetical protein